MPKTNPAVLVEEGEARGLARAFVGVFIFSLLLAYAADQVLRAWAEARPLAERWGLDGREFFRGRWWAPLSYPFMHFSPLHLALNAGALALFGFALSEAWSWRKLAALTLVSALGGAGLWLAFHHGQRGAVIGASAIVAGYVAAFALGNPRAQIPLPGTRWGFPRWVLLAVLAGVESRGLFFEVRENLARGALSHSAHVGGMLAAAVFYLARKAAGRAGKSRDGEGR